MTKNTRARAGRTIILDRYILLQLHKHKNSARSR